MLRSKLSKALFVSVALLFIAAPAVCYLQNRTVDSFSEENNVTTSALVKKQKAPLNKHAVQFVKDYIQKNGEDLNLIKKRSKTPFVIMDAVFKKYELPVELKYLSVIESELKPSAVSRVGAVGPWQLMPETAKILGLKVTAKYDERTQYNKSTKAAARYLKDLYGEFGDWLLVLAAYNGGPGPVYHAIHQSGSRNFWKLQSWLPAESREHVKKFIATHYYFEGQGSMTTLTKAEGVAFTKAQSTFLVKQSTKSDSSLVSDNNDMIAKKSIVSGN